MSALKPPYGADDLEEECEKTDEIESQGTAVSCSEPSFHDSPSPAMTELRYISSCMAAMRSTQAQIIGRLDDMSIEIERLANCIHETSYGTSITRDSRAKHSTLSLSCSSDASSSSTTILRYSQNAQLFSALILGLVCHVRDVVEARDRSSFQSGAGDRFNSLTRVLSLLASLTKPQIHMPKVLKDRELMDTFQRKSKGSVPMVDGRTIRALRDYRSRSDVFRALCDFITVLKLVPECLFPPGPDILSLVHDSLIDEQGNLMLDTSLIGVRKPNADEITFSKLNVNAYKHYISCRLEGIGPAASASNSVEMMLSEQTSRMKKDVSPGSCSIPDFTNLGV